MKKLFLLLLLIFQTAFSQDDENEVKITVNFANVNRTAAIKSIESACNCKFYFDPVWFQKDETLVSGNYIDTPIKSVLERVFDNTNINYFVDGKKVILTSSSVIYDKLPDGFFGSDENKSVSENENPIFQQQFDSISSPASKKSNPVALIGKESKTSQNKNFTLSGYIKNSKNGEGVPNINIRARGVKSSTTTNNEGFYSLQLPSGVNTIETESINHKKTIRKIVVYSNGKLDLNVEEKINQLDAVNVKSRKNQTIRTAVTGVTTIDAEGIKNIPVIFGERDILRVAISIPGIKTAGEGSSGFNVRGGKEDQNLFLLDNALLYNPSHFFGFFSALNPFTTKKVDIYKGSIPAEFGGRLSSVFDITTKNGDVDKFMGEGGIGPVTSNISLSTPIIKGKSSLLIGGRATYSDWILKKLDDESLKNSNAEFYDGIVKYAHKINDNNSVEATAYYSHDAFSISSDSLYKYSNRLVSLKWEHAFSEKSKAALILTNSEYKFGINYDKPEGTDSFDFGYKINETQAMLKMGYQYDKRHKISYGISAKRYGIHPGTLDPKDPQLLLVPVDIQKEKALEAGIYVSDSFKVNEKLLVDVGVRYSFYSALGASQQRIYQNGAPLNDATVVEVKSFKNNESIKTYGGFEPRIAARYFLAEDFSVKAGYDKSYQYIHLLSSNTTQAPTDTWKLSDLNVKPQSAQQFSLGFYKNLKDDMYELSLEGYFKKSKNILDYKVGAELLLNENVETELLQGEGKAYGVELLLKKSIGRLNGWLGYTYSRTFIKLNSKFSEEVVNNGKYFAANYDKPHDVSAVLNYKFTKRYSLSTNFVYQTGRPITYPIGKYQYGNAEYTLYSDRNKFRIPDYYRLDIGLNIEGNHKIKKFAHSFWNISVYNVLGRNNPYSVYFVTDAGKIKAYKTSIFSIPVPTITYNFKF